MLWRSRYQGRRKVETKGVARKMQKKRRDWLGKEILLGATGGRDKLGLGIVEENVWGEAQTMGRRDGLHDGALWLDKLLRQRYWDKKSELRNTGKRGKLTDKNLRVERHWNQYCEQTEGTRRGGSLRHREEFVHETETTSWWYEWVNTLLSDRITHLGNF